MTKKKRIKEAIQNNPSSAKNRGNEKKSPIPADHETLLRTLGFIVAIVGFIFYMQTIHYSFTFDDYSLIKENNQTRQGISAVPEIFKTSYRYGYTMQDDGLYRPLPKAIYAACWSISPDNPIPLHLLNVLLYALTGYLLFRLFARLMPKNIYVPFIASLLFVAHPIHTEVVANIKSMDEILAFLFFINSLYFLLKYLDHQKTLHLVIACLTYFLSLLSKESSITFIAVFPLVIYFFTEVPLSKNLRSTAFLLVPAVLFLFIRHSILNGNSIGNVSVADNFLMAAPNEAGKKATAIMIMGIYLKLLLFPYQLVYDYSFNQIPIITVSDWKFLVSFFFYLGAIAYALYTLKRKSYLSFAILFFLITISISSNIFIIIGTPISERLMYTPSFGFCFAIAFLLDQLFKRTSSLSSFTLNHFFNDRKPLMLILTAVMLLYGIKTFSQNPVWTNNMTLFESGIRNSPNSAKTHFYLGGQLLKQEYYSTLPAAEQPKIIARGMAELKRSLAIDSIFPDAWGQLGLAYYNLKNYDSAMYSYNKALSYSPQNAPFYNNAGNVYFDTGQYDKAVVAFSKAIELDPTYSHAYCNLGSTYGMMKRYDDAIHYFQQAIKYDPNYAQAYYFLSITYQSKGDQQSAALYLKKAGELDPNYKQ